MLGKHHPKMLAKDHPKKLGIYGGFQKCGYQKLDGLFHGKSQTKKPNSWMVDFMENATKTQARWMVDFMENPKLKWMIWRYPHFRKHMGDHPMSPSPQDTW